VLVNNYLVLSSTKIKGENPPYKSLLPLSWWVFTFTITPVGSGKIAAGVF